MNSNNLNIRTSNFELLRIISMLMIVSFHFFWHGNFTYDTLTMNKLIRDVFFMLGELGVNCFVLISSYFMVQSKFKWHRIIRIELQLLFYSTMIVFLAKLLIPNNVSLKECIIAFFPFINETYWFATCYILLLLISPYLNILIYNLSKKQHIQLIIICFVLWSAIPTLIGFIRNNTEVDIMYTRFLWFVVLYIFSSFIKLHGFQSKIKTWILFIVSLIIQIGVTFLLEIVGEYSETFKIRAFFLWTPNNVFMLITSLMLFLTFRNMNIGVKPFINVLAYSTFGVYLLSDHPIMRKVLWENIFTNNVYQDSPWLLFYVIFVTLIVFCVGIVIDKIRKKIEKPTIYIIDTYLISKIKKVVLKFMK